MNSISLVESNLELGEILAPVDHNDLLKGEAKRIVAVNSGSTNLRNLTVHVEGEGKRQVQLAQDDIVKVPGVWAAPGESILISENKITPDQQFSFWIRGIFAPEDAAQRLEFELVFEAIGGV